MLASRWRVTLAIDVESGSESTESMPQESSMKVHTVTPCTVLHGFGMTVAQVWQQLYDLRATVRVKARLLGIINCLMM